MNTLTLMNIKDRTWTIQACSAITKEGKKKVLNKVVMIMYRSPRGHGVARKNHLRKEVRLKHHDELIYADE